MIFDELINKNPEAVIWDGFDSAYIGYTYTGKDKDCVAVYDFYTMLDLVIEGIEDTMEQDEYETEDEIFSAAYSHLDTNVIGGYLGKYSPVVMYKDA